ncbi:hypothetical protein PAAG_12090 [Paracoccidioides lutzii Pb01]|uniref:Uncharacterized protein n=1 Tax=Paracoccidioides lutzii (strain ATCC MYA-826 / Pb01) TaxID=502779 RepID=A0A0A2V4G5_PARBA|nr:hypothetical protein PAAG_12090 [Paracoccidioides lutzii Pb01]KGQ01232.1 hypothetical protein PAAG_12090 [Paracoccidioides lutzii Pb01]
MHLGRLMHAAEIPTNIDVQKWGISLFFWGAAIFCDWEWRNLQLSTGYHQEAQVAATRFDQSRVILMFQQQQYAFMLVQPNLHELKTTLQVLQEVETQTWPLTGHQLVLQFHTAI